MWETRGAGDERGGCEKGGRGRKGLKKRKRSGKGRNRKGKKGNKKALSLHKTVSAQFLSLCFSRIRLCLHIVFASHFFVCSSVLPVLCHSSFVGAFGSASALLIFLRHVVGVGLFLNIELKNTAALAKTQLLRREVQSATARRRG